MLPYYLSQCRRSLSTAARLFTPGPLTTSPTVKGAMMTDLGSRDPAFIKVIAEVRSGLLALGGVTSPAYECVITQGSGTFGVESVLGSCAGRGGKLLVGVNGSYGERMVRMAEVLGIPLAQPVKVNEDSALSAQEVVAAAAADPSISTVAVVHHETTAGVLNPIHEIGQGLAKLPHKPTFVVDSMSAFGAYPVNLAASHIHFLVSSSNKCIEGVPGFSFTLGERGALKACEGRAKSLSLDLYAQWKGLDANGQFRFTPPTHALLAFRQALKEHSIEGGSEGRLGRYTDNYKTLLKGMQAMGFFPYVPPPTSGSIITTFLVPNDPRFDFDTTYRGLASRGFVIYPGKTTKAESFRMGSIGQLFKKDMEELVVALKEVLLEQGVTLPVVQKGDKVEFKHGGERGFIVR